MVQWRFHDAQVFSIEDDNDTDASKYLQNMNIHSLCVHFGETILRGTGKRKSLIRGCLFGIKLSWPIFVIWLKLVHLEQTLKRRDSLNSRLDVFKHLIEHFRASRISCELLEPCKSFQKNRKVTMGKNFYYVVAK